MLTLLIYCMRGAKSSESNHLPSYVQHWKPCCFVANLEKGGSCHIVGAFLSLWYWNEYELISWAIASVHPYVQIFSHLSHYGLKVWNCSGLKTLLLEKRGLLLPMKWTNLDPHFLSPHHLTEVPVAYILLIMVLWLVPLWKPSCLTLCLCWTWDLKPFFEELSLCLSWAWSWYLS